VRVLAYGDSLTFGATSFRPAALTNPSLRRPYALKLQSTLRKQHGLNVTIEAFGVPGKTSETLRRGMMSPPLGLEHLLRVALKAGRPYHMVLLWLGVNDVLQAVGGSARRSEVAKRPAVNTRDLAVGGLPKGNSTHTIVATKLMANLREMHRAIHDAGAVSVALGLPDLSHVNFANPMVRRADEDERLAASLAEVNWRVVGEAGADVHIDVASLLPYHESNGSHISHDGLHLTRAGYDALGSRLGSGIARALMAFFHEATPT